MSSVERIALQPAFVLHGRAWRETSELLEVWSRDHGRLSLVARGMRRPRSGLRACLQPFQPLLLSWSGRPQGLMTLQAAETDGAPGALQDEALMSGFYLNELLLRLLHKGDPHPQLFADYTLALRELAAAHEPADVVLRRFELQLLAESGYGLQLDRDAGSGEPLDPAARYEFRCEEGPVRAHPGSDPQITYSGARLLAIARGDFSGAADRADARRLLRAVLDHHLAGQALRSRQVYAAMRRGAAQVPTPAPTPTP